MDARIVSAAQFARSSFGYRTNLRPRESLTTWRRKVIVNIYSQSPYRAHQGPPGSILERWYTARFRSRQTERHADDGAIEILAQLMWGRDFKPGSCQSKIGLLFFYWNEGVAGPNGVSAKRRWI